jgi:hypothetical protein
MRAAEPYTQARRQAQQQVAVHNRARGSLTLCGIKGCKRHAYKGRLCRKHYDLVPYSERVGAYMVGVNAQMRAVARHHRRYLRIVREIVASDPSKA